MQCQIIAKILQVCPACFFYALRSFQMFTGHLFQIKLYLLNTILLSVFQSFIKLFPIFIFRNMSQLLQSLTNMFQGNRVVYVLTAKPTGSPIATFGLLVRVMQKWFQCYRQTRERYAKLLDMYWTTYLAIKPWTHEITRPTVSHN